MIDKTASLIYELQQHELFAAMDDGALSELVSLTQIKILKTRQTVFHQGEEGDALYFILSGRIKISTNSHTGKETILCFMGPGDVMGEIAVLDGGVRTASATVIEEARTMELRRGPFMQFLQHNPSVALHIITVLCGRLRQTDTYVEEMLTLQAGPRLARAVLRLADQYGKSAADGDTILDIKLSQATLGAHAGLMRENVNRQIKVWEEAGILEGHGGTITLHNRKALEEIAENLG